MFVFLILERNGFHKRVRHSEVCGNYSKSTGRTQAKTYALKRVVLESTENSTGG
jgi:hypothetical protein